MIALHLALASLLVQGTGVWAEGARLPQPISNNAVAVTTVDGDPTVFSFMGLDETRGWSGVSSHAFSWRVGALAWRELTPVPGPGRLAGTAQGHDGNVYLFGGYTVAEDGSEKSAPNVDIYHPRLRSWGVGSPMPVPSDDAVSGLWRDSLIYVISGWHDTDNVSDVQIYDPDRDEWTAATPIEGPPVFGHAGAIAGNTIVYLDGVRTRSEAPRFVMERSAWRGDIDPSEPSSIEWTRLPPHPGPPLYRAAAGSYGPWVLFAGGTDNPYNYNGLGYDGVLSEPSALVLGYNVETREWRELARLDTATMDHRGLLVAADALIIVGGMEAGRRVTDLLTIGLIEEVLGTSR